MAGVRLFLVTSVFLISVLGVEASDGWNTSFGYHYRVFTVNLNADEAETFCNGYGGHLLSIFNNPEKKFVYAILENGTNPRYTKVWMGLRKNTATNKADHWTDGSTHSYKRYWFSLDKVGWNCVMFKYVKTGTKGGVDNYDFAWYDQDCTSVLPYTSCRVPEGNLPSTTPATSPTSAEQTTMTTTQSTAPSGNTTMATTNSTAPSGNTTMATTISTAPSGNTTMATTQGTTTAQSTTQTASQNINTWRMTTRSVESEGTLGSFYATSETSENVTVLVSLQNLRFEDCFLLCEQNIQCKFMTVDSVFGQVGNCTLWK